MNHVCGTCTINQNAKMKNLGTTYSTCIIYTCIFICGKTDVSIKYMQLIFVCVCIMYSNQRCDVNACLVNKFPRTNKFSEELSHMSSFCDHTFWLFC